jgi:hypothetical protein
MSTLYLVYDPSNEPHFEIIQLGNNDLQTFVNDLAPNRIIKVENYEEENPESGRLSLIPITSTVDISGSDASSIVVDASSIVVDASSNIVSQSETITEQTRTPELTENPPIRGGKSRTRTNRRKALEKKKTKKRKSKE